jgi:predicted ester cyclase
MTLTDEEARNKAICIRLTNEINAGNLGSFDELVAEDYVDFNPLPGQQMGRDGFRNAYIGIRAAFPDGRLEMEDVLAEGDLVVIRGMNSGTHKGTMFGMEATGKHARWSGTRLFRLRDGKLIEGWINLDLLGMMTQLGAGASPSETPAS